MLFGSSICRGGRQVKKTTWLCEHGTEDQKDWRVQKVDGVHRQAQGQKSVICTRRGSTRKASCQKGEWQQEKEKRAEQENIERRVSAFQGPVTCGPSTTEGCSCHAPSTRNSEAHFCTQGSTSEGRSAQGIHVSTTSSCDTDSLQVLLGLLFLTCERCCLEIEKFVLACALRALSTLPSS